MLFRNLNLAFSRKFPSIFFWKRKIVDFYRIHRNCCNLSTGGLGYCKKACTLELETIMVSWYGMYLYLHDVLKMDFVLEDLKIKYILRQVSRHACKGKLNYVF